MSLHSAIGWTDATWNPVTGCTKVSEGCRHCYAEALTNRYAGKGAFDTVKLHPERLDAPLHWKKPRRIFVNSMSDLFHPNVPNVFISQIFCIMLDSPQHIFQVLTKRPERMREFCLEIAPPGNCWLGVSMEDQGTADERIPLLLSTPAAVRFVSYEPALGPLNLDKWLYPPMADPNDTTLGWVIIGGESGPNYRPCEVSWIESVVAQCEAAKVPVFVKQDCGRWPGRQGRLPDTLWHHKDFPL